MINVFDTHRLLYRNAQIRAYKKDAPTVPLNFRNYDGADIGNIVYTNENGYLCYSSNMLPVTELLIDEAAIIQVSLDGGSSWPIEWILSNSGSGDVERDDIGKLGYYDEQGQPQEWNPLSGDGQLPDYVRRDEFNPTDDSFHETTITINDDTCLIEADEWLETVIIAAAASASNIRVDMTETRSSQMFVLYNVGSSRDYYFMTDDVTQHIVADAGDMLVVQRGEYNNTELVFVGKITSLTSSAVQLMIDTSIDNNAGPSRTQISAHNGALTISDQTINCADLPDKAVYYIKLTATVANLQNVNIIIPNPTHVGVFNVVVDLDYSTYNSATNDSIKLTIGSSAPVEIDNSHSSYFATRFQRVVTVIAWNDGTLPLKHTIMYIV